MFRSIMTRNSHLNTKLKSQADIDDAIKNFTETILNAKNYASLPVHNLKSDHLITPEIRQLHKNELYNSHLASLSPNKGTLWKKTKSLLQHKETLPPLLKKTTL